MRSKDARRILKSLFIGTAECDIPIALGFHSMPEPEPYQFVFKDGSRDGYPYPPKEEYKKY